MWQIYIYSDGTFSEKACEMRNQWAANITVQAHFTDFTSVEPAFRMRACSVSSVKHIDWYPQHVRWAQMSSWSRQPFHINCFYQTDNASNYIDTREPVTGNKSIQRMNPFNCKKPHKYTFGPINTDTISRNISSSCVRESSRCQVKWFPLCPFNQF